MSMNTLLGVLAFLAGVGLLACAFGRIATRMILGPKASRNPKPGEKWKFTPRDKSPFDPPKGRYQTVLILEVRKGWVRYDMGSSRFSDERMKLGSFVRMYRPFEG